MNRGAAGTEAGHAGSERDAEDAGWTGFGYKLDEGRENAEGERSI